MQVPRNFNIGKHGANMRSRLYQKFISRMVYATVPVADFGDLSYLLEPNYKAHSPPAPIGPQAAILDLSF